MKPGLIAAACLLGQLALPTSMLLATPQNVSASKADTNKTSNSKTDTAKQLSLKATHMLKQIGMARQAITSKQTQTAVRHIDQALAERSQLASLSKAEGQSMIVPLYSELDDTSVLGPMLATRKGKPQPSMSAPVTVDDASSQYTFVGLDLDKAKSRLEAAKLALHDNNPQAASDSLAAIGDDLVVETEQSNLPLLAARENLGIAENAVKNRKYNEASAALKEASTDVDKYASQDSAKHAQEAKNLRTKIDSLSQTVSKDHADAASTIDNWWHEVDSWFTRETHS